MSTTGIIFSNIHDRNVPQLTKGRTMASIPFGCRYRLIDFVLSEMVNAGITNVGVITKSKYQTLAKHLGNGKDWDLARKTGGIIILSPYGEESSGPVYENRLEALQSSIRFIDSCTDDYIIMSDCDIISNIPYDDVIEQHKKSGADITGVYKYVNPQHTIYRTSSILDVNSEGRITGLTLQTEISGHKNFGMNVWVFNTPLLKSLIHESMIYNSKSLARDVIAPNLSKLKVMGYEFKNYAACLDSLNSYFNANMDLLNEDVRRQLFHMENYPVYTRVKDSTSTRYGENASVKNSIIADGCKVNGTVENSILFRGCTVAEGAVIKNSVILQDGVIESGASLNYIIADKRVIVRGGRNLSGCEGHPFYVEKGQVL